MTSDKTRFRAAAVAVALAMLAACSSTGDGDPKPTAATGFNAALKGTVNPSDKSGGTLKVGTAARCDSWDPATTYGGTCWRLHRVLSRTLVAFGRSGVAGKPGNAGVLTPDLAEGLGQANADKTEWTFHLRDGLVFSDGTPITSAAVKYGFERLFATDVITGGPAGYFLCLLDKCDADGAPAYKGPYKDKNGLASIATPDDRTVVFRLTESLGDFNELMTIPATAPVPQAKDKGAQYGTATNLVSSGPYMLESNDPDQSVVLTRNPHWTAASDPIRRALPDKIELTVFSNADDLDARLKTGALDVSIDDGAQPTFLSQVINDPALKANADDPTTLGMTMMIVYPSAENLTDVHCRRAVAYALDKRDLVIQAGGSYGAEFAGTLLPPGLAGHQDVNPYPSGADWTGDLDKAKAELQQCGKPTGFSTALAYSNYGSDPKMYASIKSALSRVGIIVEGRQIDSSTGYDTLSTPTAVKKQNIGLALMGWYPDYRSANGFLTLLVDAGRYTGTTSSTNFVGLNDPEIQKLVAQARTAESGELPGIFAQMDARTMDAATYLPLFYTKAMMYHSPRVTNVDWVDAPGYWDLANIGVA